MNTFNKKSLCVALAAAGTLGAAGVAQAVNVSADGLGNVLIYPYYTVRNDVNGNAFNTLMSVVNTTSSTKAVKVRFREGKNSEEVLDFNVFLSPSDVWTASITPVTAGGGGPVVNPLDGGVLGAQITTSDKSCTIPSFYTNGVAQQIAFRTTELEAGDNGVGRTSEGYFEVFEMATYIPASPVAVGSLHKSGVPFNCGLVTDATASITADQGPPSGGLFGSVIILSPAGGGAFSQAATALANFRTASKYETTGSLDPTYANANPVSNTISGTRLYQTTWTGLAGGNNAVTAVLMANAITNEYVLDAGSKSQTSWIATFPTKFAYTNPAAAPFTTSYVSGKGACEPFFGIVFNREEGSPQVVSSDDFSPQPGPVAGPVLCWEAQSIGFGDSNVFGSANHAFIATDFENGWATLGFNSPANQSLHALVSPPATTIIDLLGVAAPLTAQVATYFGLPVIGFSAETFQNDALTVNGKTYLSTFGVALPHHATKRITPPVQ